MRNRHVGHCGDKSGNTGTANSNPCATGMSDHCGDKSGNTGTATNDPCATGMSDHCGDKTGNPGTANNNPCVTDMSDHCGNKDDGHTVAATNAPVSAATLLTPSSNGAFSPSQPVGDAVREPATTLALGPPLVIVLNR